MCLCKFARVHARVCGARVHLRIFVYAFLKVSAALQEASPL